MLLVAREVAVVFDGASLLAATSLSIDPGETVAVRGPNGAGKTTLLRVLSGRLRASSGSVTLRDRPLDERRRAVRREIAALLEPPALYPDLTVIEQVRFIAASWVGADDLVGEAALIPGLGAAALEAFGLGHLAARFPHELSSGQRQLVSLAVTFARPANLLLLDEPEQRLDPERRGLVARAIQDARQRGVAIIFASHDAQLVEAVADRQVQVSG